MAKKLDMNLLQNRKGKNVSSEEALRDVIPLFSVDEVLEGNIKIIVDKDDGKCVKREISL